MYPFTTCRFYPVFSSFFQNVIIVSMKRKDTWIFSSLLATTCTTCLRCIFGSTSFRLPGTWMFLHSHTPSTCRVVEIYVSFRSYPSLGCGVLRVHCIQPSLLAILSCLSLHCLALFISFSWIYPEFRTNHTAILRRGVTEV